MKYILEKLTRKKNVIICIVNSEIQIGCKNALFSSKYKVSARICIRLFIFHKKEGICKMYKSHITFILHIHSYDKSYKISQLINKMS